MVRPFAIIGFTIFFALNIIFLLGEKAAIVLLVLAVAAFVLCLFAESTRRDLVIPTACVSLVVASLLSISAGLIPQEADEKFVGDEHQIKATLISLETKNYDRFYNVVKTTEIDGQEYELKIRISSELPIDAEPYDTIEGNFVLFNLGEYSEDSRNYYLSQNVFVGGYQRGEYIVSSSEDKPIGYYILMLRKGIKDSLKDLLPGDSGALATALLIGDKENLSEEISGNFSAAGISHLIAVSGLHLSVWCLFVLRLFNMLRLKGRLPSVLSSVFVIIFMAVSGFSYSVMRSGFMMLVMLLGNIISKRADSLNSLGFALTVLCFINPYCALSVGLQLSFLATLGIVIGYKLFKIEIKRDVKNKNKFYIFSYKFLDFLLGIVKSTVFACAFTLPVMIISFGRISLLSLPANLIVYLPATICMIFSGFSALVYFVPFLSFIQQPLVAVVRWCANFIISVADSLSDIPYSYIKASSDVFLVWLAGALFLLAAAVLIKKFSGKLNVKLPVFLCAVTFFFTCVFSSIYHQGDITVTVCDVGNGSAIVVSDNKRAVMIGCGGDNFYAQSNIEKAITDSGAEQLDFLMIPRISQGESSLAADIVKDYRPQYVLAGETDSELKNILKDVSYDVSSYATIDIWDNVSLTYKTDAEQSSAVLSVNSVDIMITFKPIGDILDKNTDVLISREKVPNSVNAANYALTVLSSDYEKGYYQQTMLELGGANAAATAEQGNIKITVSTDGKISAERV
ncbi:MAG: ComEC/Rec2 family competence protein [Oscillospiraceae bacterium]|nr:ComEC/Rec2 family competence protein [Oscillospiraceae bacterium]